ncbi:MAG: hypothetical protein DMF57_03100 [Acidobacteria bacterium]|nr:MAG: hypothetical protein DMF57_03100 [Acidobacteriota bacterium]
MMRRFAAALLALAIAACAATQPATRPVAAKLPPPPPTEVRPVTETVQGVVITDPYRWLEDQTSTETRAWIERENSYTDSVLNSLPDKQRFAKRIESLLNTDQLGAPVIRGGRYFFTTLLNLHAGERDWTGHPAHRSCPDESEAHDERRAGGRQRRRKDAGVLRSGGRGG